MELGNNKGGGSGLSDDPSKLAVRVGVVEVGSRAIRLLVAEISASNGLVRKHNNDDRKQPSLLGEALMLDQPALQMRLAQAQRTVNAYLAEAQEHGATRVLAFGTEALRRLTESTTVAAGKPPLENVTVLDRRTEGLCSLITAANVLRSKILVHTPILLVDEGAGSTEFIVGQINGKSDVLESVSLSLGSADLVKMFVESGWRVSNFQRKMMEMLESISLPPKYAIGQVIAQGSPAANAAWITKWKGPNDRYHPGRVHGVEMQVPHIFEFLSDLSRVSRQGLVDIGRKIYPYDREGIEFLRSLTGLVLLALISRKFHHDHFIVSANGTRDGVALRLAGFG